MKTKTYDGAVSIEISPFGQFKNDSGLNITFAVDIKTRESLVPGIFESYVYLYFDSFYKFNFKHADIDRTEGAKPNRIKKEKVMKYLNME